MKKSFSLFRGAAFHKLGFLPFLMTFLFFAALQVDMKAQVSNKGNNTTTPTGASTKTMFAVPTGAFVSVSVAKERLMNAMITLKASLEQLTEGTAPYTATVRRITYYRHIFTNLEAGKGVAESIALGIEALYNDLSNAVTPEEALVEKNAAISLLRP